MITINQAKKAEVDAALNPFAPLSRPAFLFMLSKIGKSKADVEALIAAMPKGTQAEQDAKLLAGLGFAETTTFNRDNALLNGLAAAAGFTTEQIDAAWRQGEQLTW